MVSSTQRSGRGHAPVSRLAQTISGLLVAVLAGQALGQNALGDGTGLARPLERDLGRNVPARRPNTAAAFQQELALRNAVVTGNAPGGASFRGDVGYVAPSEFRGTLGSNDLFAFRRDSLFSGFAGLGIRGTEALQYQFALSTGTASGLLGVGSVAREGGGIGTQAPSTLADPALLQQIGQARDPNRPVPGQTGATGQSALTGSLMGMLRSPSSYIANRSIQPEILGTFNDPTTNLDWGLTASALRGVRMSRILDTAGQDGARPEFSAGGSDVVPTPTAPNALPVARPETQVGSTALPNSYQAMLERFREAAAGRTPAESSQQPSSPSGSETPAGGTQPGAAGPGSTPLITPGSDDWNARLQAMRDRLTADLNPLSRGGNNATTPGAQDATEDHQASSVDPGSIAFRPLDAETLRIIRQSATSIQGYAPSVLSGTAYEDHMAAAGALMRQGSYFDAEERFTRAQAARPDDYLATVGRMHAQIGAGMFLSAGINLRALLSQHPEVAGTRFDAAMLPDRAVLDRRVKDLRANASEALNGRQVLLGADSALLIAYLGYQLQDRGLVTEGLDLYARLIAGDDADPVAGQHGAALLDLIRGVWGDAPQGSP